MRTVLHEVAELGQSVWLDTISRDLTLSEGLERWIEQGSSSTVLLKSLDFAALWISA